MKVMMLDNLKLIKCPGCNRVHPIDSRWTYNEDRDNPTFSPSLLVNEHRPHMRCHSFIKNGHIQFLSDCFHSLAGQTVVLPEWHPDDDYWSDD